MKDLNIELKRFADMCAKVRPDWNVRYSPGDGYAHLDAYGSHYDTYFRADCGAMIFWLLDEFPDVDLSIRSRGLERSHRVVQVDRSAFPTGEATCFDLGYVTDEDRLHHIAMHRMLVAVNSILEQEAR